MLIQWVSKHSPKGVNQYAISTSVSTPSLSALGSLPGSSLPTSSSYPTVGPSGSLPPLPALSPTLSQRALNKRKGGKGSAAQGASGGSIRAPTPPPLGVLRAPSPSFSSGLSIHAAAQDPANSVVRSASADAASGLGGSLVAAYPRTTSAFNIMREPARPRRFVFIFHILQKERKEKNNKPSLHLPLSNKKNKKKNTKKLFIYFEVLICIFLEDQTRHQGPHLSEPLHPWPARPQSTFRLHPAPPLSNSAPLPPTLPSPPPSSPSRPPRRASTRACASLRAASRACRPRRATA